ncbi:MAG: hypothetical protein U0792_20520 [Gemmataceae bacterium]
MDTIDAIIFWHRRLVLVPIRLVCFIPFAKIGWREAIEIAQAEATKRGDECHSPRAIEGLRTWEVLIDRRYLAPPKYIIDNQTGKLIRIATLPR